MTSPSESYETRQIPGQLVVYDREMNLDVFRPLLAGDTVDVIRGNGPREGDWMGTVIVTGFENDGSPILSVHFAGGGLP